MQDWRDGDGRARLLPSQLRTIWFSPAPSSLSLSAPSSRSNAWCEHAPADTQRQLQASTWQVLGCPGWEAMGAPTTAGSGDWIEPVPWAGRCAFTRRWLSGLEPGPAARDSEAGTRDGRAQLHAAGTAEAVPGPPPRPDSR